MFPCLVRDSDGFVCAAPAVTYGTGILGMHCRLLQSKANFDSSMYFQAFEGHLRKLSDICNFERRPIGNIVVQAAGYICYDCHSAALSASVLPSGELQRAAAYNTTMPLALHLHRAHGRRCADAGSRFGGRIRCCRVAAGPLGHCSSLDAHVRRQVHLQPT